MKKKIINSIGRLICKFLKFFPLKKNYIFFESFLGKNYGGNPKYIYEELLKKNGDRYTYIWSTTDTEVDMPGNPIVVKRPGIRYLYYAMRSKYWVSNVRLPKVLVKRKNNIYLQTWHGTPLKRMGFDIQEVHIAGTDTNTYRKEWKKSVDKWDYLIAPNEFSEKVFKSSFNFGEKMLLTGYPRNDLLYSKNDIVIKKRLKESLGIKKGKKVILYAPTWRDDENEGINKYRAKFPLDLKKMQKKLGEEWVLLVRTHYIISEKLSIKGLEEFVFDVSKYNDVSQLYLASDILITDYSSVMFDYANTGKPMLFYTYDLKNYRDKLRGFYFDFKKEAPGPLVDNENDLIEAIKNIESISKKYTVNYQQFREKFCSLEDGKASQRVVKEIWGDD